MALAVLQSVLYKNALGNTVQFVASTSCLNSACKLKTLLSLECSHIWFDSNTKYHISVYFKCLISL